MQTKEEIIRLFDNAKLPIGINYCDWLKLTQEEKEELWAQHLKKYGLGA